MPFFKAPALHRHKIVPTSTHNALQGASALLNDQQINFIHTVPTAHIMAARALAQARILHRGVAATNLRVVNAGTLLISGLAPNNPMITPTYLRQHPNISVLLKDEDQHTQLHLMGRAFITFDVNLNTIMNGFQSTEPASRPEPIIVFKVTGKEDSATQSFAFKMTAIGE